MRPHELRAARKALGLSQDELGRLLGLGPKHPRRMIHEYEAGRYAIPAWVPLAMETLEAREIAAEAER